MERIIENRVTDDQGQTETFLRSPVTRVSRSYLAHATRSVIPPSFRSLVGSRYLGSPPHPFVRSSFTSFTRPLRSSVTSGPPSLRSVGTTEGSGERLGGKEDDRSEAEISDARSASPLVSFLPSSSGRHLAPSSLIPPVLLPSETRERRDRVNDGRERTGITLVHLFASLCRLSSFTSHPRPFLGSSLPAVTRFPRYGRSEGME